MYFLTTNRPNDSADPNAIAEAIQAHRQWVREQLSAGRLVQAGRWQGIGGMAIIRADREEEARALAAQDPLALSGLSTAEFGRFFPEVEGAV